jgi:hypothetical protein
MMREEILRKADEADAAFNRRDAVALAALYSEDARFLDQANGSATQLSLTMEIADDVAVHVHGARLAQPHIDNPGPSLGIVVVASLARSVSVDPGDDGGTTGSMVSKRCKP